MWELDVPKTVHFYWGGGKLIYMRYLSIVTFMRYNPDWQVIFWYPAISKKVKKWGTEPGCEVVDEKLCKDYLSELLTLPITKVPINFFEIGLPVNTEEVHKNDYIRINVLNLYGGVWSDMDILYFNPMEKLKVNIPQNKGKEVYVCISDYGHSTGFNMATKGSHFFNTLNNLFGFQYKPNDYQCWGPDIFNKYFKRFHDIRNAVNLSMDVVYAHDCHHVLELLGNGTARFTDGSIGCHWYGGNSIWGKFINETRGGEYDLPDNIIGNLIKKCR